MKQSSPLIFFPHFLDFESLCAKQLEDQAKKWSAEDLKHIASLHVNSYSVALLGFSSKVSVPVVHLPEILPVGEVLQFIC